MKEGDVEALKGMVDVQTKPGCTISLNVDGWILDKEKTKANAEKNFFSPDGKTNPLPHAPGFTHVERKIKRGTHAVTWSLVNKQPRTTVRNGMKRRDPPMKAPTGSSLSVSLPPPPPPPKTAMAGDVIGTLEELLS